MTSPSAGAIIRALSLTLESEVTIVNSSRALADPDTEKTTGSQSEVHRTCTET